MQSPSAVSTLKQLKDGTPGQDAARYALAALFGLGALAAFWSAIASNF